MRWEEKDERGIFEHFTDTFGRGRKTASREWFFQEGTQRRDLSGAFYLARKARRWGALSNLPQEDCYQETTHVRQTTQSFMLALETI
jgi:hypothetical protein